jgi:hypothetical protein
MLALGLSFDVNWFKIFSHVLNHKFHVLQDSGQLGIPVSVNFDLQEFWMCHEAAKTIALIKTVSSHDFRAKLSSAFEGVDSYDQGYLYRTLYPKLRDECRSCTGPECLEKDFIFF